MPSIQSASHVALTVRDMEGSAEWYQRVFGLQVLRRYGASEAGPPRILLFGLVLGAGGSYGEKWSLRVFG